MGSPFKVNSKRKPKAASLGAVAIWIVCGTGFYVFSVGPMMRLESIWHRSDSLHAVITKLYGPLFLTAYSTGLQGLLQNYIFLWIPDRSLRIPQKNF